MERLNKVRKWVGDVVRKSVKWFNSLPLLIRLLSWLVLQGLLYEIQPTLWRAINIIVSFITNVPGIVTTMDPDLLTSVGITAIILIQATVITVKLNNIEEELITMQLMTGRNSTTVASDGGKRQLDDNDENNTSGIGAIGGASAGAAIGSVFGPAGLIGGAALGAILGNEYEEKSQEKRAEKVEKHRTRTYEDDESSQSNTIESR